jgi:type VI secretion system protein ImpE
MVGAELLETGRLLEAIERVAGELRVKPGDLAARTFYFELLSLSGDLDRAVKQLDILSTATNEFGAGVATYLGAIQAERERRTFFQGGPRPRVMSEPPYAVACLEAVEHYAAGDAGNAMVRLENASAYEHHLRGLLNGSVIDELNDSHDLLGPFLELVTDNHYAWVPWEAIQSLTIPEPRYLRDTIWTPASMSLHSGDHGEVLLFSLYVNSHLQPDEVRLGRRTVWEQNPAGFTTAYGQKVISASNQDYPILEIRTLEVEPCRLAA